MLKQNAADDGAGPASDLPPKNRVRGSTESARIFSGNIAFQVLEPHQDNGLPPTTLALERTYTWLGAYGVWDAGHGLYLTRYRAYDANLCRFLQTDPIGLAGGLNLYVYGSDNPLAFLDPLGLCEQFVNTTVQIAQDMNRWWRGPDAVQRVDAGGRLADYSMPQGNAGRYVLGTPFQGTQYGTPLSGITGVRPELTQGGQGNAAYRHVGASASAVLEGLTFISTVQDFTDRHQEVTVRHTVDESAAELFGNEAGRQVGQELRAYMNDSITADELQRRLISIIGDQNLNAQYGTQQRPLTIN